MTLSGTRPSPSRLILVRIAYDHDADVWYVEHSDVPGLRAEGPTADALMERIPGILSDLIEENGLDGGTDDMDEVAVEIIASASARVKLYEAA
jgi:Domain of unknown function (DUF1902)